MNRPNKSVFRGCLLIMVCVFMCSGVSFFAVDQLCQNGLRPQLPLYPGAQVVYDEHNFVNRFGMGITTVLLHTPDDEQVVNAWYGRTIGATMREALKNGSGGGWGQASYTVEASADGSGSDITLYGKCAN